MSIFDRFRRKRDAPVGRADHADAHDTRAQARPAAPPELTRLEAFGRDGGPDEGEVLALLSALHGSPFEARALDSLATRGQLPEAVAVAVARVLSGRGEPARALGTLGAPQASAGIVLAADLVADTGDIPRALALIERVLRRDLTYPGARERHARWRTALGHEATRALVDDAATRVVAKGAGAPFVLLREVARGGAGAVYEGEDRELLRRVAVKVYHQPSRDAQQLRHEATVAAALAGPGVARVFDVDPESAWLALEWAPLGTLRDAIRARDLARLTPMLRWAGPLAAGIARVHDAGWVHNDVKPANVLLMAPDAAVLTDFGIARRAGEPAPPGSVGYVSPERMAGRPSHPADDVYGFGRVLEDALDALADPREDAPGLRALASACTGPDAARPASGSAILALLRVEKNSL